MIVSREKYFDDAFVLRKGDVQKVADVFRQSIGRPTFEIECRDGAIRRFDDVSALFTFENGWSKRIRSLWIRSAADEYMRRARLRFSTEHAPIYFEIAADADVATALDGAMAGAIKEMRPGYVAPGPFDLALALVAGCAAAVTAFFAILAVRSFWQASGDADLGAIGLLFLVETGGLALAIAAGCLAGRPPGPLFPRAAFVIGRGILRARLLWAVRGGLFLAAAGSLAAMIILNIGA